MKNKEKEINLIDTKITNADNKLAELQHQIKQIEEEKAKLFAEKHIAIKKTRTKEQDQLVKIREVIKYNIDKYNELAEASNIKTAVGLLTNGGSLIYQVNDENENDDGECFSDDYYVNKYPSYTGWYPSSLNC